MLHNFPSRLVAARMLVELALLEADAPDSCPPGCLDSIAACLDAPRDEVGASNQALAGLQHAFDKGHAVEEGDVAWVVLAVHYLLQRPTGHTAATKSADTRRRQITPQDMNAALDPDALLKVETVATLTGFTVSTIRERTRQGRFPAAIRMGPRTSLARQGRARMAAGSSHQAVT
jgi:predicted DNA-binding transcriptional regulator AlpA